jgi:ATP-binding protein involved in chromosome partitioning
MSNEQIEVIRQILGQYIDPYLETDLVSAKIVKDIKVVDQRAQVRLQFGYPMDGVIDYLSATLSDLICTETGLYAADILIEIKIHSHKIQKGLKGLANVKNIIAIASGKGGVGKSTTAVNLALALQKEGATVGILDADIYGPSQPTMLGANPPAADPNLKHLVPVVSHGIQSMSIGYLIDQDTPMIWRGPMVSSALQQLLNETAWENVDYLIVDLPPGTGDIQLTLAQKIPVTGAIIVTTPQDIALLDARKAYGMFRKVEVPVLGVIENMSVHICTQCGHHEAIFGAGGGSRMARQYDIPFLGELPLDIRIREQADNGTPTVVADPEGEISLMYREIARRVAGKLARESKDYTSAFPNIVVEQS